MSDSLVLNGLYELIDQTTGSPYQVTGAEDLGAPVPDTATIEGTLLDGDSVTGIRSGNRTITLPVQVYVTSKTDISAKVTALVQIVDQPSFTLAWTPDGCPTTLFDCRRGDYARTRDPNTEADGITTVTLEFPALPFGRSTSQQTVTVPASGGPAQLQLDGMNSGTFSGGGTRDTTTKYEGASSDAITMTRHTTGSPVNYYYAGVGGRALSSTDLSSYASVSVRMRANFGVTITALLTLNDSVNGPQTVAATAVVVASGDVSWHLVRFDITEVASQLTSVTGWAINFTTSRRTTSGVTSFTTWVDDLRAYPAASTGNSTAEGQVLTIPSVLGSARSPLGLQLDVGGTSFVDLVVHCPPIDQDPDLTILAGLASGSVVIPAANSDYAGTYSVVALCSSSPSGAKTLTATFEQKIGGTTIGGPTSIDLDTSSGSFLHVIGMITLPLTDTPPENQSDSLTITLTTTGSDIFTDVLLLDTRGQTVVVQGLPAGTEALWVDPPAPLVGVGPVYSATTIDRTQAYSAIKAMKAFSAMLVDPGDNRLLAASTDGAPNVTASYTPSWLDDAQI